MNVYRIRSEKQTRHFRMCIAEERSREQNPHPSDFPNFQSVPFFLSTASIVIMAPTPSADRELSDDEQHSQLDDERIKTLDKALDGQGKTKQSAYVNFIVKFHYFGLLITNFQ